MRLRIASRCQLSHRRSVVIRSSLGYRKEKPAAE